MFEFFDNRFDLRRPRLKNYALHWLHRLRLLRFVEQTRELPGGLRILLRRGTHDEVIVREVWEEDIYPLAGVDLARGERVIDIGAQIGSFSLLAASRGARVLAFEPSTLNQGVLRRNVALNALEERIEVQPAAIYRPGASTHTLYHTYTNLGGHSLLGWVGPATRVECLSLDEVFERFGIEDCRVLKLDVEGAECPILYSASRETLGRIGLLFAEVIDHPALESFRLPGEPPYDHEGLMEFLRERGFDVEYDEPNKIVIGRRRAPGASSGRPAPGPIR